MLALLEPYLLWIKLGLAAAVLAGLALFGWRVHAWHDGYKELARERACEPQTACAERAARVAEAQQKAAQEQAQKAAEVVATYEQEIADNRRRAARSVRLCAPAPGDVRNAAGTGSADGPGTAAGVVPGQAGPDIGAGLYRLAQDADEVAARLRALQAWAAGQPHADH